MSKTVYAALAFAASVALAGPAFADKYKATLDAKSEVPPNASTRRVNREKLNPESVSLATLLSCGVWTGIVSV